MIPTNIPRRGPPRDTLTKFPKTPIVDEEFPFAKSKKRLKKSIAVPSLSKDYPSTNVLNLTLAPSSFKSETTATGSVAESTHPNVKA